MKTTTTIFLLCISIYLFNQNIHYQWVKQYESLPGELMFDAGQNPVFATYYQDTLFFEGDTFAPSPLVSQNYSGLYLGFDKNGDYNDHIRFPYPSYGFGIDSENNYYFSGGPHGYYLDTLYIGNDSIVLDNNDSIRSYIVQYDSVGSYNWHKKIYATDYLSHCVHVYNGTTDNQDNFYVHGSGSYIRFETDTSFQYKKYASLYLAKYYKNGSLEWAKQLGLLIDKILFDHDNNPVIYGNFYNSSVDTVLIENDTLIDSNGENVITKFDTNGNLLWYKQFNANVRDVHVSRIDGSIFILGTANNDTLIIGSDTIEFPNYTNGNPNYVFLAKLTPNGDNEWTKYFTGNDISFDPYSGNKIGINSAGSVFICGTYDDSLEVDNLKIYETHDNHYHDAFLIMFDPSGNANWIKGFNEYATDGINDLKIDNNDNIYLIYSPGNYNSTITFNQISVFMTAFNDLFIKMNAWNTFVEDVEYSDIVSIYPNPTNGMVSVKLPGTDQGFATKVNVYDINGQIVKSVNTSKNMFEIDLRYEMPGIYIIRFNNPDFNEVHKIIKQ